MTDGWMTVRGMADDLVATVEDVDSALVELGLVENRAYSLVAFDGQRIYSPAVRREIARELYARSRKAPTRSAESAGSHPAINAPTPGTGCPPTDGAEPITRECDA